MKIISISLALAALAFVGCGRSNAPAQQVPTVANDAGSAEAKGNGETLSTSFKPGQGLWVPEITRQSLALQIVEVTERILTKRFRFQVQVFRAADDSERGEGAKPHGALALGMVSIEEARQLKPGQTVSVRAADKAAQFAGRIAGLDEQTAKVTGFVETRVEIDDRENRFALGSFLEAMVPIETAEKAIAVPQAALLRTAEGDCVYAVNGKYLFRTPVTAGTVDGGFVEIKEGLFGGDQVASHPVMSLWLAELAAVKGGQSCCLTKPAQ